MCMVWPCYSFVDGLSKNALMCKKVRLINHDCLCVLMLLYLMLYIMLAYLMLFAALSNAVCSYNALFFFLLLIFAYALCYHALSWFICTYFVYFKYDFPSCAVLLICWYFLIPCLHHFYSKGLCALWRNCT